MRVKVLLFASLREAVGEPELPFDLPEGAVLSELADAFYADYPSCESMRGSVLTAVNGAASPQDTPLDEGDEVAFLPPVSGG